MCREKLLFQLLGNLPEEIFMIERGGNRVIRIFEL